MDNIEKKELTRLDRVEDQLKKMNAELARISSALVGDEFSAGIGLIHQVQHFKKDLDIMKEEVMILKDNMKFLKWLGSTVGASIVGVIIYLFKA